MSKYIPGNQKHLTLNDRIYIENELARRLMLVEKFFSVTLSAPHALLVIRLAEILKRNVVSA